MSREDPHFRLRFPDDLRKQVEAAAKHNKRSMTAEILARLERTFEGPEMAAQRTIVLPESAGQFDTKELAETMQVLIDEIRRLSKLVK